MRYPKRLPAANYTPCAILTNPVRTGSGDGASRNFLFRCYSRALYKTEARGLPSGLMNQFGEGRYHLSFWSVPHRTRNGCSFQIPYMAGWGGNLVVLLPNGITAFRLTDGHNWDMEAMVLAGEAIRPFPCPAGSPETPPPAR